MFEYKWIEDITLKFGICYIVQKVIVNNEQILFHQKGRIEAGDRLLSQARALICLRMGMLFEVGLTHASDFGIVAGVILTIRC